MLARISSVIDPSQINCVISNHVEPDHSYGVSLISSLAPSAKIVTSAPNGLKGLRAYYGELPYETVKAGDSISLGKRTLQFIPTPMLHWPDSMVTYCPEEKILFSNDAFGQHLASGKRFDDENDLAILCEEAKKYYANILFPYGAQAKAALKALHGLDMEMIATGHGIIWRSHIPEIIERYKQWSSGETEERAVIVFDSMWHSTEAMAHTIAEAFIDKGYSVGYYDIKKNSHADIMTDILTSRYLAVGSPTLNNTMLPTIGGFLCYMRGLAPKGRKAFAFGSYGWGGQSIQQIEDELKAGGCEIAMDKVRILYVRGAAQGTPRSGDCTLRKYKTRRSPPKAQASLRGAFIHITLPRSTASMSSSTLSWCRASRDPRCPSRLRVLLQSSRTPHD